MTGALLIALGAALVLLGWALSALLVGGDDKGGGRLGTAARAVPYGVGVAMAVWGLGRLYALARGTDPSATLGVVMSIPPSSGEVGEAFGRLSVAFAAAILFGTVCRAFSRRGSVERAVMGWTAKSDALGALLAGLLGAALLVMFAANPVAVGTSVPLDVVAFAPLLALSLSIRLTSRRRFPPDLPDTVNLGADELPLVAPDPVTLLAEAGLIEPIADHIFRARRGTEGVDSSSARLWSAVGGTGGPPGALAASLERVTGLGALVVPDVPGHIEHVLLAAILLGVLTEQSGRAFVVTRTPEKLRDRVVHGLGAIGSWLPGALVATDAELKESVDSGRLPAAVFVTPEGANATTVPWLAHGLGTEFARQLSCVVLSRPDRLDAVRSAHLYFTLARLRLHGRDGGPRAAVVTAHGSDEILKAVNTMLGSSASRIPLHLPSTERVRVHRGSVAGGAASREGVVRAIRQAWAVLRESGVSVTLEDSAELLSASDLGRDRTRIELDLPGALRGDCTLMVLADDQLGPVFRVAGHRPPGAQPWGQVIVWWILPGPVANFLLEPGRLAMQLDEGILPAPAPLFARENTHLSRLHLLAALHEGNPEEERLRVAFGARRVTELLEGEQARRVGMHAELEPRTGSILRSHVLAPARGQQRPDTSRRTMTRAEVRVVDGTVGDLLDRVDRLTAKTHYYPHRVFGSRGRRYQVPAGGGFDAGSGTITVEPVGNDLEPTLPDVHFEIDLREWLGERDQRSQGKLIVQAGEARVVVHEVVERALSVVGSSWSRFEQPVTARYGTQIKVVWLRHLGPLDDRWTNGLLHLARMLDDVLIAWLRCRDENIEVVPRLSGFDGIDSPALLVVDRHVGGAGVADALSLPTLVRLLRWVRAVMTSCACDSGCVRCTPPEILHLAAKNEAIGLLGN